MISTKNHHLHENTLILLLVVISTAFGCILWPFSGAVLWSITLSILFSPLHQKIASLMPRYPNLPGLITLAMCLLLVVIPFVFVTSAVTHQIIQVYQGIQTGGSGIDQYFDAIFQAAPPSIKKLLSTLGIANLSGMQSVLSQSIEFIIRQLTPQALLVGRNAFYLVISFAISFAIMFYLLFYLLRDGQQITLRIRRAMPLDSSHFDPLAQKFATVVRATIRGSLLVAIVQGALTGVTFSALGLRAGLLWGVTTACLSLIPAGTILVWVPAALYLFAIGAFWKGVVLVVIGSAISTIDNVLRPILVGKETHTPDYLVLLSSLGGMSLFGLNGLIIGPTITALFIAIWGLFSPREPSS